jgi:hypothetical protein
MVLSKPSAHPQMLSVLANLRSAQVTWHTHPTEPLLRQQAGWNQLPAEGSRGRILSVKTELGIKGEDIRLKGRLHLLTRIFQLSFV